MKRSVLVTVILAILVLSYSPARAGLSVDSVGGLVRGDTIMYGAPITFYILWDGSEFPGCDVTGLSNGYRLYSPTGTPFTASGEWNPEIDFQGLYLDGGVFAGQYSGGGEDTIGFSGFRLFGPGVPDTFYDVAHMITLEPFPISTVGGEICIDSSAYGCCPWLWNTTCGQVSPSWSGPHCYTIANCCVGIRGDANLDGSLDVADLGFLINYLFQGGPASFCHDEADVNASTGVAVTDLTYLVDYLFRGGLAPSACPEE